MMQIDLLTYQPTAEEMATTEPLPAPKPPKPASVRAMEWQQTKADFYLAMMNRFMNGALCSQVVRRHEIQRLHQLREAALAEIRRLTDA